MQNRIKYRQQGDFKPFSSHFGSTLNREIKYKNTMENFKIRDLDIYGYDRGLYDLKAYIKFSSEATLRAFIDLCPREIKPDLKDLCEVNICDLTESFYCWININNKKSTMLFLNVIQAFDPLDDNLLNELFVALELNKIVKIEELIPLIQSGKIQEAIDLAKQGQDEALWELGQYCENNLTNDLQKAIDCYQEIPSKNKYYQAANDKLLHLLMRFNYDGLDKTEQLNYLQLKFRCAFQSGKINQRLVDQLFHELCGYSDANPKVNNIQEEGADTFIAIANLIRELVSFQQKAQEQATKTQPSPHTITSGLTLGFLNSNNAFPSTAKKEEDKYNYAGLRKGFLCKQQL